MIDAEAPIKPVLAIGASVGRRVSERAQRMLQAHLDMRLQRSCRTLNVTVQRGFEHFTMLLNSFFATMRKHQHLIAQIFVIENSMQGQQVPRPASLDQREVKLPVIPFPILLLAVIAFEHLLLHKVQLVMRGYQIPFPVGVTSFNRQSQCMTFQQNAQVGDFDQVFGRNRCNEETALILGINKPLARKPVQGLAQRGHRGRVAFSEPVQLEFGAGGKLTEYDIALDALVGRCTYLVTGFGHVIRLMNSDLSCSIA